MRGDDPAVRVEDGRDGGSARLGRFVDLAGLLVHPLRWGRALPVNTQPIPARTAEEFESAVNALQAELDAVRLQGRRLLASQD